MDVKMIARAIAENSMVRLKNDGELKSFFAEKPAVKYIMEEFIDAEVNSYDAIVDGNGEPIFETGNVTPQSIMDIVNENDNSIFYIQKELPDDVRDAGRRTLKAFKVKNRFVHFEFFRLKSDQHIGRKGEVVALEVNMRPSGGISPDMMNYANSIDVYKVWADMIAFGKTDLICGERYYCAYAGRRDGKQFRFSEQEVVDKFGANIKIIKRVSKVLSGAMGDTMFIAAFTTKEQMEDFYYEMVTTQ